MKPRRQGVRAEALVVFTNQPATVLLRLLKPGFRHCFVVLRADGRWIVCDPLKHRIVLRVLEPPAGFDLAAFYLRRGFHVCKGHVHDPPAPRLRLVPAPLTCVSVAKRLLGIEAAAVVTPWQLFVHLTRRALPGFLPLQHAGSGAPGEAAHISLDRMTF